MPEPESNSKPEPEPNPNPETEPNPKPETESNPKPEIEQIPKPETEPNPNPNPETESVPAAQTQQELESRSAVNDADLRETETSIRSNEAGSNHSSHPQLRKDEGNRTFTMRELLNGLKNDSEPDREDANSPYRFAPSELKRQCFLFTP